MECEMCGKEGTLYRTEIEGSKLNVCENCKVYGKVISRVQTEGTKVNKKNRTEKKYSEEPEEFIVDDFFSRIKKTRESNEMTQEDLGKKIKEKESLLHHIESGKVEPSFPVARKLEKTLGITLVEKGVSEYQPPKGESGGSLTVGDMINLKKRTQK